MQCYIFRNVTTERIVLSFPGDKERMKERKKRRRKRKKGDERQGAWGVGWGGGRGGGGGESHCSLFLFAKDVFKQLIQIRLCFV